MSKCVGIAALMFALVLGGCGGGQLIRLPDESTPQAAMPPVAATGGAAVESPEPNMHEAVLPRMPQFAEAQREDTLWCWAACATMIHNYYGNTTTQEEVVARVRGNDEDVSAAWDREIMIALYPEYARDLAAHTDREFQTQHRRGGVGGVTLQVDDVAESYARYWSQTSDHLVRAISQGEPVVVGLAYPDDPQSGHALVVYGVRYSTEDTQSMLDLWQDAKEFVGFENRQVLPIDAETLNLRSYARLFSVHSISVIDPWTGQLDTVTGEDLAARHYFMLTREVAEDTLREEWEAIRLKD